MDELIHSTLLVDELVSFYSGEKGFRVFKVFHTHSPLLLSQPTFPEKDIGKCLATRLSLVHYAKDVNHIIAQSTACALLLNYPICLTNAF